MFRTSGSRRPMEPAPEIDRVEWLSSSPEAVLVRVHAHRAQPSNAAEVRLIIDDGGRRRTFAPDLGLHVDEITGAWSASFSVPIELRPRLEGNLALEVGGLVLALPGALAGRGEGEPTVDAQVIDRGVLAERRARRAEIAEQALLRRASEAEATVDTLQRQLANLEQRFARTNEELERLRRGANEGEAERRRLRQREYAEQQQRLESEERVRELRAQIAGESDGLRASLREAERKTERLTGELERVQRALAEAQHAAAAERANLRRAREDLAAREAEFTQREQQIARGEAAAGSTDERVEALGTQLHSVSDHLGRLEDALEQATSSEREARAELAAERARHDEELAALQRRVEELRGDLATAIGLVRGALAAEHDARVQAEAELRAAGEAAQALREELERAHQEPAATALAVGELPPAHAAEAASEAEVRRQREEMAEALAAAVARLRARVAEFEQAEAPSAPAPAQSAAVSAPAAPQPAPAASEPSAEPPAQPPADAVELPRRLQGVRPRPTEWLASALRQAAVHRDAQLVGELIAEMLPAQGLAGRRSGTYGVTIDDVGCYRVATTGLGPASVARVDPAALSGLDFEIRGSVAQVGTLVAAHGSWRLRGLRVTPGRGLRARRVTRARTSAADAVRAGGGQHLAVARPAAAGDRRGDRSAMDTRSALRRRVHDHGCDPDGAVRRRRRRDAGHGQSAPAGRGPGRDAVPERAGLPEPAGQDPAASRRAGAVLR